MVDIEETPQRSPIAQQPEPPSAGDAATSYEVPKRWPSSGNDDAETSDPNGAERGVYEVWSKYLNDVRFFDEQYGIRRIHL